MIVEKNGQNMEALVEPSFYGVSFAKSAYNEGHKVISIVSSIENPRIYGYEGIYHDLIVADIRDEEALYNAIRNSSYYGKLDALIPATDYASHITAKVAEKLNLKGIPYEAALKARNKDLANKSYEECGVPSAKYSKIKNYEEAVFSAETIGYPVVLKPTNAASSQNVFFISSQEELKEAMDKISNFKVTYMDFSVRDEYLIEEYLDGPEFSVEVFLDESKPAFAVVTEKITSPLPYFVEIVHTLPTSVHLENKEEIINVALDALKAIGINNGPSHVEVKLTKKGPMIIEVNGRPGGDNISSDLLIEALGIDIFKATVDYYLDNPININISKEKSSAIAYLLADREGIVSEVKGIDDIKENKNVVKSEIYVKPGDKVTLATSSDDRLGYVITLGNDSKEAKDYAVGLISNIKLVYAD